MKIALIADIHGNLAALEAALDAIARERPDRIVCLGDVAATGPQPREVLARLRALACPVVMGNADAELLAPPTTASTDEDTARVDDIVRWGAAQLDDDDRAFIASFPATVETALGAAGRLLCCHGSPRSYDDIIGPTTPDEALAEMLAGQEAEIIAGGHTHSRLLRAFHDREIVNPGSVGRAYQFFPDGSARVPPWAEFAILTATAQGTLDVEFRRVAYDQAATMRAIVERGMPHAAWWSADWR
jgi:predicted phosphodiesterase